jgi:DNA-binding transcriptional regulator YdaS (Cro superfamily)
MNQLRAIMFGMETLHAYLKTNGLTQQAFAQLVGTTQGSVSNWLIGRARISAETARQIERATGGGLKAADLRPDVFGQ